MVKTSGLNRIFYGYRIVAALWYSNAVVAGCMFYTFTLFVTSLQDDFSWGRGQIMIASTIIFLVMGCSSPLVGRLINTYGASRVMAVGAAVGGIGFIILSQTHELWQFYLGYTLVGIGSGGAGHVPATAVVSNWFIKRRGTALGIMATGIGAGGLILAPLFGGFFIPDYGWQTSYLIFAVLIWAIVPLALGLIRTKPSDIGMNPDGVSDAELTAEVEQQPPVSAGLGVKSALSTSTFWLLAVSLATSSFAMSGVMQNQGPYLEDVGLPLSIVSTVVAIVGAGSLIGKFFFGWLCDRLPAKYVWCIALTLQLSAIVVLMNINSESVRAALYSYAMLLGLGFGGWLPAMSMLTGKHFGLSYYGVIFGMLMLGQGLGASTGPLFAGNMYDAMGTYQLALIIYLALYAVAIPATLLVRRPKLMADYEEQ